MTQEFHLRLTLVAPDNYLVQTTKVASSIPLAQELVRLPIADWLARSTQLAANLEQARADAESLHHLINLGQEFYAALFSGSLQTSWNAAGKLAQQQRQGLRLRLGLPDELASLPWEILHTGDRFLVADPTVAVSRYLATPRPIEPLAEQQLKTVTPTLLSDVVKVLVVVAAPQESVSQALQHEIVRLQVELCQLQITPTTPSASLTELEFTLLEQPSIEDWRQALEQEQYQIIHYIGEVKAVLSPPEPYLASGNPADREQVSAATLASLLHRYGIHIAVFNFCYHDGKANANTDTAELQLSQQLVKSGVHTILTMGRDISAAVALISVREFYRHLSQGYAADFSLSRVRTALLSISGVKQLDWARPIFYLQPEADGNLTTRKTTDLAASQLDFIGGVQDTAYCSTSSPDLVEMLDSLELETLEEVIANCQDDDPSYQEDSALVADLFHQIVNPAASSEWQQPSEQVDEGAKNQRETPSNYPSVKLPSTIIQLPVHPPSRQEPNQISRAVWLVLGVVGIPLLSFSGLRWQHWQPQLQAALPPIYQFLLTQPFAFKLKTASAADLAAIATAHFRQQDLSAGYLAVTELLDRKELNSARVALAAVSPAQAQTGRINFLRGRLAWQALQAGDKDYTWEDVRHYWEAAVKYQPNSPVYYNALGFAYYAVGDLNRANQTWFQALYLVEEQQAATPSSTGSTAATKQIALNTYAGLALVLSQAAIAQPQEQAELLSEALKLQQKVLKEDPVNFRPQTISRNWLWTEQAAQDWRSLLAVSSND